MQHLTAHNSGNREVRFEHCNQAEEEEEEEEEEEADMSLPSRSEAGTHD